MSAITHVHFYPSDWLAGTRGMTAAQMGVYITLIAMMYERAGPIRCDDMPRLARLCGTSASAMTGLLAGLISDGKISRDGDFLSNRRAMLEIENVMSKSEVAREKSNARWQKKSEKSKDGECSGIEPAMLTSSHKPEDISSLRSDIISREKNQKNSDGEKALIEAGCEAGLIADWKAVRKAKGAGPITKTVADGLIREAGKAGLSPGAAVRECVERGWQGFRADWMAHGARAGPAKPPLRGSAAIIDALTKLENENATIHSSIPESPFRQLSGTR